MEESDTTQPLSYCKIIIDDVETIYNKIAEINFLFCQQNILIFDYDKINIINNIFNLPCISENELLTKNNELVINNLIILKDFSISVELKEIYDFKPINYVSSGKLGDFIQVLSVINEIFHKTGKKGNIFIQNDYTFSMGISHTFKDTYDMITSQKYIKNYKIYNNENIDINLDSWFLNKELLYHTNWYNIFKNTYNVEWGQHKWLNIEHDTKWENKILINVMNYRKTTYLNFNKLHEKYGDSLIFISFNILDYDEFIKDTKFKIKHFIPKNFSEACIAINSCKLFIGSISGLLTVAHACHKTRVMGLNGCGDDIHNTNLDTIWSNVYYSIENFLSSSICS